MHILGIGGMPRRVADYSNYATFAHFQPMNQFISIVRLRAGTVADLLRDQLHRKLDLGQESAENPWEATTLEWNDAPARRRTGISPKFRSCITARTNTASPLVEEDWLPQTRYVEGRKSWCLSTEEAGRVGYWINEVIEALETQ